MRALNSSSWSGVGAIGLAVVLAVGLSQKASGQAYFYDPGPDYYHNDTASDTFLGGVLGAMTGAIAGGKKNRGEGALIGAGVGAVTGNLFGRAKDQADDRQAAAGAATVQQLNEQAAAMAVSNHDLVRMTHAGVNEQVIISTMRSRGARLDLSPQALISLKEQGVSDQVVLAAQGMRSGAKVVTPTRSVIVRETAPVIVTPVPRYYYGRRYRPRAYPRGHIHYRVRF